MQSAYKALIILLLLACPLMATDTTWCYPNSTYSVVSVSLLNAGADTAWYEAIDDLEGTPDTLDYIHEPSGFNIDDDRVMFQFDYDTYLSGFSDNNDSIVKLVFQCYSKKAGAEGIVGNVLVGWAVDTILNAMDLGQGDVWLQTHESFATNPDGDSWTFSDLDSSTFVWGFSLHDDFTHVRYVAQCIMGVISESTATDTPARRRRILTGQ